MENISELVRRSKNGDIEAFELLYQECYKDLYRLALYTLGRVHDADDRDIIRTS